MCYPRYIEYALRRRRALNADLIDKSCPHKYLFNAEWNLVHYIYIYVYICYPRYIEYGLRRRRALNADVTAKSCPHKYLFNAEWNLVQGSHLKYKIFF
mgnify:CR=1 FL=1